MNLQGKVVWITGASSGIGEALAHEYANRGAKVILSSRNEQKLAQVAAGIKAKGIEAFVAPIDLENSESIKSCASKVLQQFHKIDILVNNGGISQRSYAVDTPIEVDRKIMETNFFGAVALTKEVLPALIEGDGGKIVVISSIVGKFGFPLRTAYSASKHALQGFFEALRSELFDKNVTVTIVSPGKIHTNISVNAITKNGAKYGIMDESQEKGMTADECAKRIVRAANNNKKELLLGGKSVIMVYIHKYLPCLFYVMARKVKPT